MTPDQVPSLYQESQDAIMAPLVMRHGLMHSITELGHINDPAQADDLGHAPMAGSIEHKSSIYASGGGRTLRVGQPEFSYWDMPGMRAIELLDLFTVATQDDTWARGEKKNLNQTIQANTTLSRQAQIFHTNRDEETAKADGVSGLGLININTAPYQVLSALFYGITPTSDQRFTHSILSAQSAVEIARVLKEHRPYEKLSDLRVLTPLLANATTYTPSLSTNTLSDGKSLAAVFDRAREEGFGKMISLCTMQSRAFRVYVIGESLSAKGIREQDSLLEASLLLLPKHEKDKKDDNSHAILIPVVQQKEWLPSAR
jgi:hypothetical protein